LTSPHAAGLDVPYGLGMNLRVEWIVDMKFIGINPSALDGSWNMKPSVFEGCRKCVIYLNSLFVAWCLGKGTFFFSADTAAVLCLVSQFRQLQLATAPVLSKCCASSFLSSAYNIR